jgi:hypothetical protein
MTSPCPESHINIPPDVAYDMDLFRDLIYEAEEEITATTLYDYSSPKGVVDRQRPSIERYALYVHGNPSESAAPITYHEAIRTSEETIRRALLRGLGHMTIVPLLEQALAHFTSDAVEQQGSDTVFTSDIARGRVHRGVRGHFVSYADKELRVTSNATLDGIPGSKLEQEIIPPFVDTTLRVRSQAEQILTLKFGNSWRQLDPMLVTTMQITEIDGKKLNRHDQRLLLGPYKLTNIYEAVGNAVVAAAEFTAIGIEHLQKALNQAGCPPEHWYAYGLANLSKLGFMARLPFWTAQDIGIHADNPDVPLLFTAQPQPDGLYEVTFTKSAHQKYYDKDLTAACQGAVPPKPRYMRQGTLRTMGQFVRTLATLSNVNDTELPHDWSSATTFKPVTSAEAATAATLGMAYSRRYDFTSGS